MKRFIIIFITIGWSLFPVFSQNSIDEVLAEVVANNTTISALREKADAQKIGNRTDIFLPNPEAEFHYLWSDPSVMGTRTDFSISQSFDFPTAYRYRNQLAGLRNEQAELEYIKQLKDLHLETKLICYDLIYVNALKNEYETRVRHAREIKKSVQTKFDVGETNILELNKARLNFLNVRNELESIRMDQDALLTELAGLNGGDFIHFADTVFADPVVPDDFAQWIEQAEKNNSVLSWLQKEIEIDQKQIGLSRALSLPRLKAGYMSESVGDESFEGVMVGVSIPLWENKNKVKYARANVRVSESLKHDRKLQFYNNLKALHAKADGLQDNVVEYRKGLQLLNNFELLKKSLDKGEISLINYLLELSFYYESMTRKLQMERDLNIAVAELNRYDPVN